ncbi:MAG TPA: sugar phosphate isomerase/epimerase [Planctomycetota bacterium]|nr:sugar phosphate isomerase/epimerase [Planctomycetota bacterium]
MNNKIGVNSWVWTSPFTDASLGLLDKAASMGFSVFEIALEDPSHVTAAKASEALQATGLRPVVCGAFGPSRDLTHDDPEYREESLRYIDQALAFCEKIGAKVLCGPMYSAVGKRRQVSPEQKKVEWDRAVSGLSKAAKLAANRGVTLAIEPLNRFETDLVNTSEQALKLVNDINYPAAAVHLDTFHMNIEEKDFRAAVRTAGKKLAHVHACENDRGAPGSGVVNWSGFIAGLKDIGYSGDLVIESFTPECKAIAAAAAIWRPLAKTQDDLAREGLAFLKRQLA